MDEILQTISRIGIVPVIAIDDAKKAVPLAKALVAAADVSGNKVAPRGDLLPTDFDDIWWVGDYSDKNGATNGGFVAIKLIDALSTGGFQLQSTDKGKGQFAYEFTGHYSIADETMTPPFEIYVKPGAAEQ